MAVPAPSSFVGLLSLRNLQSLAKKLDQRLPSARAACRYPPRIYLRKQIPRNERNRSYAVLFLGAVNAVGFMCSQDILLYHLHDTHNAPCALLHVKLNVRYRCVMARDDPHFRLRIPEALKSRIEKSASDNNRSMTAEIVSRLEQSFEVTDEWSNALENINDALSRIETLERQMQDVLYRTGSRDYPGS